MSKAKQKTEQEKKPITDFMPNWKLEEECYKDATVRGKDEKGKPVVGTWPRTKPIEQTGYENWLDKVVNKETGEFYPARDQQGLITKDTAHYAIRNLFRVKTGADEFLMSTGVLIGYDNLGDEVRENCHAPEKYVKTTFQFRKYFNEKKREFESTCIGPQSLQDVYTVPFTREAVMDLFSKKDTRPSRVKQFFYLLDKTVGEKTWGLTDSKPKPTGFYKKGLLS